MNNQEFRERAAITLNEFQQGGILNPAQDAKLIRTTMNVSKLRQIIGREERFTARQKYLDKVGVSSRVAVPRAEASDPLVRRYARGSRVLLTPADITVPYVIGDNTSRFNVEGKSIEDTILEDMGAQLANDIDLLGMNGSKISYVRPENEIFDHSLSQKYILDGYLGLIDGFLKQAEAGNVIDAQGDPVTYDLLNRATLAIPVKYTSQKDLMKYLMSYYHKQVFIGEAGAGVGALADSIRQGQIIPQPGGHEIIDIAMLHQAPFYSELMNAVHDSAEDLVHKPVTDVVVTDQNVPSSIGHGVVPYLEGTDYTVDYTNGKITVLSTGSIGNGAPIHVTYQTGGKILLTPVNNMVIAIGREIMVLRDVDIFAINYEFAIHASVDFKFIEPDAVVMIKNIDNTAI